MRPIFTLDCETDPFKHGRFPQPFLWGIFDGSSYQQFEHTEDVVDFVKHTDGIFYAHNGGKFDYHFLLQHAEDYSDIFVINGRLAKWKLGLGELRDSYNILPIPLKDYKKDDFDYTLMERENRNKIVVREKIEEYLKHDCVYLHELVTGFISEHGFNLTQAGASMRRWRKQSGVRMPETDGKFFDTLKPYYFGGRVQAFRMGVGRCKFRIADVNSAYPRAMLEQHPFGESIERVKRKVIEPQYFYLVSCVANGCWPFRGDDLRLHYYRDNVRRMYAVTGWEFIAAQELGLIKYSTVESILQVKGTINFKDYINDLWKDRRDAEKCGNVARRLFDKLLMNSLYGKFGADPRKYFNHFIMPAVEIPADPESEFYSRYDVSGYLGKWGLVKDLEAKTWSRFYCVATSASITGYQRAIMMRQLARCLGLLYCDTDGIASEDLGEIDSGDDLGQWEIDERVFDFYAIGGRKIYAFGSGKEYETACKGAHLGVKEIIRVASGQTIEFKPEAPTYSLHNPVRFINRDISLVEDV